MRVIAQRKGGIGISFFLFGLLSSYMVYLYYNSDSLKKSVITLPLLLIFSAYSFYKTIRCVLLPKDVIIYNNDNTLTLPNNNTIHVSDIQKVYAVRAKAKRVTYRYGTIHIVTHERKYSYFPVKDCQYVEQQIRNLMTGASQSYRDNTPPPVWAESVEPDYVPSTNPSDLSGIKDMYYKSLPDSNAAWIQFGNFLEKLYSTDSQYDRSGRMLIELINDATVNLDLIHRILVLRDITDYHHENGGAIRWIKKNTLMRYELEDVIKKLIESIEEEFKVNPITTSEELADPYKSFKEYESLSLSILSEF